MGELHCVALNCLWSLWFTCMLLTLPPSLPFSLRQCHRVVQRCFSGPLPTHVVVSTVAVHMLLVTSSMTLLLYNPTLERRPGMSVTSMYCTCTFLHYIGAWPLFLLSSNTELHVCWCSVTFYFQRKWVLPQSLWLSVWTYRYMYVYMCKSMSKAHDKLSYPVVTSACYFSPLSAPLLSYADH